MKILERLALILFSIVMIVLAITSALVVFNILELATIFNFLEELIDNETARNVILGSAVVALLLAVKALFFPSRNKRDLEIKSGILLENKDGKLLISKDTIENLVSSVARSFDDAIDVQTRISLDANNVVTVFVSLLVKEDAIIKELSTSLQTKIKETVKRNTDLDVSQVNINIRNIENSKSMVKLKNQPKIKLANVKINESQSSETKE